MDFLNQQIAGMHVTKPTQMYKVCRVCGKTAQIACAGCRASATYYCAKTCQVIDWEEGEHSVVCGSVPSRNAKKLVCKTTRRSRLFDLSNCIASMFTDETAIDASANAIKLTQAEALELFGPAIVESLNGVDIWIIDSDDYKDAFSIGEDRGGTMDDKVFDPEVNTGAFLLPTSVGLFVVVIATVTFKDGNPTKIPIHDRKNIVMAEVKEKTKIHKEILIGHNYDAARSLAAMCKLQRNINAENDAITEYVEKSGVLKLDSETARSTGTESDHPLIILSDEQKKKVLGPVVYRIVGDMRVSIVLHPHRANGPLCSLRNILYNTSATEPIFNVNRGGLVIDVGLTIDGKTKPTDVVLAPSLFTYTRALLTASNNLRAKYYRVVYDAYIRITTHDERAAVVAEALHHSKRGPSSEQAKLIETGPQMQSFPIVATTQPIFTTSTSTPTANVVPTTPLSSAQKTLQTTLAPNLPTYTTLSPLLPVSTQVTPIKFTLPPEFSFKTPLQQITTAPPVVAPAVCVPAQNPVQILKQKQEEPTNVESCGFVALPMAVDVDEIEDTGGADVEMLEELMREMLTIGSSVTTAATAVATAMPTEKKDISMAVVAWDPVKYARLYPIHMRRNDLAILGETVSTVFDSVPVFMTYCPVLLTGHEKSDIIATTIGIILAIGKMDTLAMITRIVDENRDEVVEKVRLTKEAISHSEASRSIIQNAERVGAVLGDPRSFRSMYESNERVGEINRTMAVEIFGTKVASILELAPLFVTPASNSKDGDHLFVVSDKGIVFFVPIAHPAKGYAHATREHRGTLQRHMCRVATALVSEYSRITNNKSLEYGLVTKLEFSLYDTACAEGKSLAAHFDMRASNRWSTSETKAPPVVVKEEARVVFKTAPVGYGVGVSSLALATTNEALALEVFPEAAGTLQPPTGAIGVTTQLTVNPTEKRKRIRKTSGDSESKSKKTETTPSAPPKKVEVEPEAKQHPHHGGSEREEKKKKKEHKKKRSAAEISADAGKKKRHATETAKNVLVYTPPVAAIAVEQVNEIKPSSVKWIMQTELKCVESQISFAEPVFEGTKITASNRTPLQWRFLLNAAKNEGCTVSPRVAQLSMPERALPIARTLQVFGLNTAHLVAHYQKTIKQDVINVSTYDMWVVKRAFGFKYGTEVDDPLGPEWVIRSEYLLSRAKKYTNFSEWLKAGIKKVSDIEKSKKVEDVIKIMNTLDAKFKSATGEWARRAGKDSSDHSIDYHSGWLRDIPGISSVVDEETLMNTLDIKITNERTNVEAFVNKYANMDAKSRISEFTKVVLTKTIDPYVVNAFVVLTNRLAIRS